MLLNSVGSVKLNVNVKGFFHKWNEDEQKKTPFDTKSYLLQLAVKPAIIFHKELLISYQFYPIFRPQNHASVW